MVLQTGFWREFLYGFTCHCWNSKEANILTESRLILTVRNLACLR